MARLRTFIVVSLVLMALVLAWGADLARAQDTSEPTLVFKGKITAAEWKAAAARFRAAKEKAQASGDVSGLAVTLQIETDPNSAGYGYYIPDYYATANWANSPALAKFVDPLPMLWDPRSGGPAPAKCLPIAVPDTLTYPDSDYYEISLIEFFESMHSGLPNPTRLRGYVQTNMGTNLAGTLNDVAPAPARYLGPVIIAQKDRPVRIKFTNNLPTGTAGKLFVPTDTTIMGAGKFEINYNPETNAPAGTTTGMFAQNRGNLHLHGGHTPWISDGTPHQWITPLGEPTSYPKGSSVEYVPDMWFNASGATITSCAGQTTCAVPGATNNPGPGSQTYFYTNQQSARFMFYHDHAWGITRLNVYVGEAAGYMIQDPVELAMITGGQAGGTGRSYAAGTIPEDQIPLVIQDKTFVDGNPASETYVLKTDPTWAWGSNPGQPITTLPVTGDLWWPHVYAPAQNPYNPDMTGINAMGRWHYGPWFFPATPVCGSSPGAVPPLCITYGPVPNPYYDPACDPEVDGFCQPPEMPGTPNPSWGAEAFMDTITVNGAAFPRLDLAEAKPYRFRILNAAHDRFLNLQLYKASPIVDSLTLVNPGSDYREDPLVTITANDATGKGATAEAIADLDQTSPTFGQIVAINLLTVGSGYTAVPTVTIAPPEEASGTPATATATIYTQLTEVGMVPAVPTSGFPATWPKDSREGGAPDPATRGPAMIQIATEGGFLPAPVVLPNVPVNWNNDVTTFNAGNVLQQADGGGTLFLGPAERADVIVDFTNFAGSTLILYNDAPAPWPALDPHYDYYTGAPDRTDMGGALPIPAGVGPNIRTVMQIVVPAGASSTAPPDDYDPAMLATLTAAFATDASNPGAFEAGQEPVVVAQNAYDATYNMNYPAIWPYWGIARISDYSISFQDVDGNPVNNWPMEPKAIQDEMGETFDDYGRMSAKLGLETPFTNAAIQNFILQNFVDPPTEIVEDNKIQIWRITHNGVDTHPVHFHLFDVQVLNRVGWDGFIRLPDPNELGWKDTVRISPLEDTIVALRPTFMNLPFELPNSVRPLNPSAPLGSLDGFSQQNPNGGGQIQPLTTNEFFNFGDEYVWHCHILSHEENDMMRGVSLILEPAAPVALTAGSIGRGILLSWTNSDLKASKFTIQRATDNLFSANLTTFTAPAGNSYVDTTAFAGATYYYRVMATNAVGPLNGTPLLALDSGWSNTASASWVARPTNTGPAVAWNSTAGQFQIAFQTATDARVFVGTAQANGTLNNDWVQLPTGRTRQTPAIVWNAAAGKVQIAVQSYNTADIYVASYNADGTGLSAWTLIPAGSLSGPAVTWNSAEGKVQLAIRGTGSRIFVGTVNGDGTAFSGWTQLATGRTGAAPSIAWNPLTSKVQFAVKGYLADNSIWVNNSNADGSELSAWTPLAGGTTLSAPAITWNPMASRVSIAIRGTSDNILKGSYDPDGTGFSLFDPLTGAVSTRSPAIAINPNLGTLNLFARDALGNLVEYVTVP